MARKVVTVTIDASNRDAGKVFEITEMSAMRAEKWATRALLAVTKSGVEIPEDIARAGLAGVAALGIKIFSGVKYEDAEPLLREMMECVAIIPNPADRRVKRALVEDDIEEVSTLLKLREDVFALHLNFSPAAFRSKLASAAAGMTAVSPNIATSH